jgi:Spy/CpxP family protein refolding chaperone
MQRNPQTAPAFSRRWTLAGIAAASVAIAGAALAWHGHAHAQGPDHGHHMHGGWEQMDPEVMGRRIEAMTALRLAEIDATPEQKSRIAAIMKAAANDLSPLRGQGRELRRKSMQLLAAPTIDRAQLEAVRAQQMQLHETASRRMLQARADAAEVLTPEQRAKLAERMQRRFQRG